MISNVMPMYRALALIQHSPYKILMLSLTCCIEHLSSGSSQIICRIRPFTVMVCPSSVFLKIAGSGSCLFCNLLRNIHSPKGRPFTANIGHAFVSHHEIQSYIQISLVLDKQLVCSMEDLYIWVLK